MWRLGRQCFFCAAHNTRLMACVRAYDADVALRSLCRVRVCVCSATCAWWMTARASAAVRLYAFLRSGDTLCAGHPFPFPTAASYALCLHPPCRAQASATPTRTAARAKPRPTQTRCHTLWGPSCCSPSCASSPSAAAWPAPPRSRAPSGAPPCAPPARPRSRRCCPKRAPASCSAAAWRRCCPAQCWPRPLRRERMLRNVAAGGGARGARSTGGCDAHTLFRAALTHSNSVRHVTARLLSHVCMITRIHATRAAVPPAAAAAPSHRRELREEGAEAAASKRAAARVRVLLRPARRRRAVQRLLQRRVARQRALVPRTQLRK
jgi:hypothetical protein